MMNYDETVEANQNSNWPYFPNHCHRILIVGGCRWCVTELNKTSMTRY